MTSLLDVNLLIALFWPAHYAHGKAQRWFAANSRHGWATCPITETGFVRIVANPAFSRRNVSPRDALLVLSQGLRHPDHLFWTDDLSLTKAFAHHYEDRLQGHNQVTDAYLLSLVIHRKGRLATLDEGLPSLLANKQLARNHLVLV